MTLNPDQLADILATPKERPHHNAGCSLGEWMQTLDEPVREHVRGALDNEAWDSANLRRVLIEKVGMVDVGYDTLRRHRMHECECEKVGWR